MVRLLLLSGAMPGSLLSLGRSIGVARACGLDGVRARRGLVQTAFPGGADVRLARIL